MNTILIILAIIFGLLDSDANLKYADAWIVPNQSVRYDVTLAVHHVDDTGETGITEFICIDVLEDQSAVAYVGTNEFCNDVERVSDILFYGMGCEADEYDLRHYCPIDYDPDEASVVYLPLMGR